MTLSACDSNFSFTNDKKFDVVECESCKWTFKTQNMKIDSNEIGTYNNDVFVSRNPSCWGMCDYKIQV